MESFAVRLRLLSFFPSRTFQSKIFNSVIEFFHIRQTTHYLRISCCRVFAGLYKTFVWNNTFAKNQKSATGIITVIYHQKYSLDFFHRSRNGQLCLHRICLGKHLFVFSLHLCPDVPNKQKKLALVRSNRLIQKFVLKLPACFSINVSIDSFLLSERK